MTQTHHISWKTSHKRQIETLSDGLNDFLPPSGPLWGREGDETSACFKGFVPAFFFFLNFVLTCNPSFQAGFDAPAMSQIHLNTLIAHYGETPFKLFLKNPSSTSSWLYLFLFFFFSFFQGFFFHWQQHGPICSARQHSEDRNTAAASEPGLEIAGQGRATDGRVCVSPPELLKIVA